MEKHGITFGISFGTAMAMIISYMHLNSLLWMVVHGLLSWFYVVYFILFRPY